MSDNQLISFKLADGTPVYLETTGATVPESSLHRVSRRTGTGALEAESRFEEAVAFMLRCHAGDEFWEVPEWAVLTLTLQRGRSLLRLCETVRDLGVYKIADLDYSLAFYAWGEDDSGEETVGEPVRTERSTRSPAMRTGSVGVPPFGTPT
jgi:hypothetical protein